jgi:hypothetical protein
MNNLNNSELERLYILNEELHEVGQIIGKILRFGYGSNHPLGGPINRNLLEYELGHLQYMIDKMCLEKDIDINNIKTSKDKKSKEITKFLQYNK